jgi:ADP-ribose pyrophosphatase
VSDLEKPARPDTGSAGQISSRRVYTGRIINLDIDTVRFPNGSTGELEMIRHPGASAVIPFLREPTADGEILLIKQYRYAAERFLYEVPAGRLDPGETPADCARRELKEETGCTAEAVEYLFTIFTTPGFTDEQIHVFVASGLERGDTAHETDEFLTVEAVTLPDAIELVRTGGIVDAKTAIALLYTREFRCRR